MNVETRIEKLTKKFESFVDKYYKNPFSGPSVYFHGRVLYMIRNTKDYRELLEKEDMFIERIYATLASWGMHRMTKSALLEDFENFKQNIRSNIDTLEKLTKFKLHELDDNDKEKIKPTLSNLFENLEIMKKETKNPEVMERPKLVGNSKTLHHLLPDLIPPIDRRHTINFFYKEKFVKEPYIPKSEEKQKDMFLEVFDGFYLICKKVDRIETIYWKRKNKENFTTSIPKLIDNAIIGYVRENRR
jgi:hypothetical protein